MQMFAFKHTEAGISLRQRIATFETSASFGDERAPKKWDPSLLMTPFRRIVMRACRVFKVSTGELKSARRGKLLWMARQFVYYWACRLTDMSTPQIARLIGGRDHTTVLHGRDVYPKKRAKMGRHLREVR